MIKYRKLLILLSAGFAGAGALPALAEDCPPLTLQTSLDMRIGSEGRVYVPVTIADKAKYMLVDTGGGFTEITSAAATELQLATHRTNMSFVGVSGSDKDTDIAASAAFAFGNQHTAGMNFAVDPDNDSLDSANPDAIGIMAPDVLRIYDLDFDFAGKKVNFISPKHCDGKVVYWPADTVAVVPMRVAYDGHITVTVTLDGHRMKALLDTGSTNTILNFNDATDDFGLKPGSADMPVDGQLDDAAHTSTYRHTFKSLSLEGLAIANPQMEIVPDLMKKKMIDPTDSIAGGSHLHGEDEGQGLNDIILGMDVIRHLHLYIAYKEQKLYITPATPSPAPAPTGAAPAGTVPPGGTH